MHHRAEHDRRHQHSHQFDEEIAQRLHELGKLRPDHANGDSEHHRNENLHRQVPKPGPAPWNGDRCISHAIRPHKQIAKRKS